MLKFLLKRFSIDSTISSIGIIDNKLPVCEFFDNVLFGRAYSINVLVFTIEGEPEFRILTFDGKQIKYTLDSSKTSLGFIKNYYGNKFIKKLDGEQIYYDLYQDSKFVVSLLSYRN
ncbi:DUF4362 domain-containing protein [Clostridium botulinum]|uniref:DUF4362 domain-containing protein n=3 Tax=Clostridium botulinum TaxID=1491 RepID=A0A6B4JJ24_CLOBO|nr:DUF4362 domain-containing protein [Clostridium botulinum]EES48059.1 conserved hypothetical protein [Clostridium botulinum E1 str. 'BoNT E Beluga']MBY6760532.1 DUF4362 domain-containing protein [Clostridium botulinum]MBY6919439.1 DUF4362 domain-containing protein [Clostridium botulinum]MCR1130317.1 DUF4362 domain-containing protein [Clostridium botulinum]NFJ56923.1 DUF4362 domain-containing protein [Clostridium botulinum]